MNSPTPTLSSGGIPSFNLTYDIHDVAIIIASLAAALVLAGLAVILTTTRGNRISDYDKRSGAALNVQIYNQFKLATGVPVVALYVLAVVAGISMPTLITYSRVLEYKSNLAVISENRESEQTPITLRSTFHPAPKSITCVERADFTNPPGTNWVDIPLEYTSRQQSFLVTATNYPNSVTLNATLTPDWRTVIFDVSGIGQRKVQVTKGYAQVSVPVPTLQQ